MRRAELKLAQICALSIALAGPALAGDEPWAVASITSHHFSGERFNQHNYGAGFEYPTSHPRLAAIGGFYDNSFERTSVYAGVAWTPLGILGVAHLGLLAGAITGYVHPVLPLLLPTVQLERDRFGLNIIYAPKIKDGAAVLGFQIKARF